MAKPDFDRAEMKARDLRLQQSSNDLKIDVRKLSFDLPIYIDTFQHYSEVTNSSVDNLIPDKTLEEGYTAKVAGIYIVLYDGSKQYNEHINWTLAHEIGHVYLGHSTDKELQEVEAHCFAAELLAPENVIRAIAADQHLLYHDLQNLFGLSLEAATKRKGILNKNYCLTYRQREILQKYKTQIETFESTITHMLRVTTAEKTPRQPRSDDELDLQLIAEAKADDSVGEPIEDFAKRLGVDYESL